MSGTEAVKALKRLGFFVDRQRGSHVVLKFSSRRELAQIMTGYEMVIWHMCDQAVVTGKQQLSGEYAGQNRRLSAFGKASELFL